MSTTYCSHVLVGYGLEELFKIKGEGYEDMYDFREGELCDLVTSTCDFVGYELMGDCEIVEGTEEGFLVLGNKIEELYLNFEVLTGVTPVMKSVLTSY